MAETRARDTSTAAVDLVSGLAAKADLASPSFTGTVDFSGATVTGLSAGGWVLVSSQTPSSASSVIFNNVFTASNQMYAIVWRLSASAGDAFYLRMRLSGTDDTSSNYAFQWHEAAGTSIDANRSTAQNTLRFSSVNTGQSWGVLYVMNPAAAGPTFFLADSAWALTAPIVAKRGGGHNVSTAYDGITLYPGSGNVSGRVSLFKLAQ